MITVSVVMIIFSLPSRVSSPQGRNTTDKGQNGFHRAARSSARPLQRRGFQVQNILDDFVQGDSRSGSAGRRGWDRDFCFENYLQKSLVVIVATKARIACLPKVLYMILGWSKGDSSWTMVVSSH